MRAARGMSATELAKVAGISPGTIYRIENNEDVAVTGSTVMAIYRSLELAGRLDDEEWADFRECFGLKDAVRMPADSKPPVPPDAARSPAVQLASFLRTLDPNRAAAMQLVFEMIDRAGAEKVVETLEALKRMLNATIAPGTLVHRKETIHGNYRVTELTPHQVDPAKADAKTRAKKIGG